MSTMPSLARSMAERLTATPTSEFHDMQSRQAALSTYSVSLPMTPISSAMAMNFSGGM
ncbi:hypothetical protein D3C71_2252720 [compost metagenome]